VDPLAGVFPPTVQDPVVPLISLPSTFQSKRVNCDKNAPEGSSSIVFADLKGPGCVRHIWILDYSGKKLHGKFSIEILVDGAEKPQVYAPVKAFFGVMNDQEYTVINSSFSVLPNIPYREFYNEGKEEGNPGYNMFLPIPFSKSCRITLHNPSSRKGIPRAVGMVDWHKYERGAPLTPLRLHADYRYYNPSKPSGNHVELANIEGAGFIHGMQLGFDQLDFKDCVFHTSGVTILIDGETNPHAIRGHNAEDDFGIAWGFNIAQTPWLGCPWYKIRPDESKIAHFNNQIGSYYRFFTTDPIVFRSSLSFRSGSRGDIMESVIYSYRLPGTKAPKADLPAEWQVGEYFETKMNWNAFKATAYPQQMPELPKTIKTDHGWVDLHAAFVKVKNSAYILTNLKSATDKSAMLRLAIPGWANVWVNGKKVKTLQFGYSLDTARIPIKLRKGDNELFILSANPNHIWFMRHWMINAAIE